ncbi:MAG: hypothetical protein KAU58_00375 [Candidatus Omnitrophica bacterium]|nr:hypothetical protein [Candidatus Omnitrophota bacterium]
MARICDKCKKEITKITKDVNSFLWLCEDCLKEAGKSKKRKKGITHQSINGEDNHK